MITEIIGGTYCESNMTLTPQRGELPIICFAASKYTPGGWDKGFDVFVELARQLADRAKFVSIGNFFPADAPGVSIEFRPFMKNKDFAAFMQTVTAIVSVSRLQTHGGFDGFPNGSTITAGFAGAAMITADPLGQNMHFKHGENMLIVEPKTAASELDKHWHRLDEIGLQGQARVRELYCPAAQITPRVELLRSLL